MSLNRLFLTGLGVLATTCVCQADPRASGDVRDAAQRIDAFIDLQLAEKGVAANPELDDASFARRVYLDAVGRIPTARELRAFLEDGRADKRARLIETLLDSPGHRSAFFHFWADLLRAKTKLNNRVSGEPYLHWIKQALEENKPYDVMVRELIAAQGPAHMRGNGATGYYLRDQGMPLDNMANTARIFLGTRLECAQCHNDPFQDWTQQDFFGMAAFTGGIKFRGGLEVAGEGQTFHAELQEARQRLDKSGKQALNRMLRGTQSGITGTGTGLIRLPHDYKYEDAAPSSVLPAKPLFGPTVDLGVDLEAIQKREERRARNMKRRRKKKKKKRKRGLGVGAPEVGTRAGFGEWLTAEDNPRFARVIANRLWKRAFGRGLIEPIDDMRADTEASNPELMTFLEQLIKELGYDLRAFQAALYNTRAYQREATRTDVPLDAPYAFPGPVLRRMSGEQLWDSLLTLRVHDVDGKLAPAGKGAEQVYTRFEKTLAMNADELVAKAEEEAWRRKNPKAYRQMMQEQKQAERQRKAEERKAKAEARKREQQTRNAELAEKRKAARPVYRALNKAQRAGDQAEVERLLAELEQRGAPIPGKFRKQRKKQQRNKRKPRRRKGKGQLARASDLRSPAPPGHFLRQFGQSDREQIEGAHTDPTVPQVLSLLNGFLEDNVLHDEGGALMGGLAACDTPTSKVALAFQATLGRLPNERERKLWEPAVLRDGQPAVRDMVWTLVNAQEFRFVR